MAETLQHAHHSHSALAERRIAAGLTSAEIDAVKGGLICLIVLGHSHVLSQHVPELTRTLYNFHAAAFLVLPFIFAGPRLGEVLRNRSVRYLAPLLVVFTLATVLFSLLLAHPRPSSGAAAWAWVRALVVGSSDAFDRACGMELFWFLPALLGLTFWRACLGLSFALRWAVVIAGTAMLLSLGLFPRAFSLVPTPVTLGLYALPLGLLLSGLSAWLNERRLAERGMVVLGFLGSLLILALSGRHYNIADLRVPGLTDPAGVLLYGLAVILATPAVGYSVRWLRLTRPFAWLGRRSLQIYLGHLFLMTPLQMMVSWPGTWFVEVAATCLLGVLLPALTVDVLRRLPRLRSLVFPRDAHDFTTSLRPQ